jgi:putative transposase
VTLIEQRDDDAVPLEAACDALGVSRAALYRARKPAAVPRPREPAPSPRRLTDEERRAVLDVLHEPRLLGRGVYLASIRTMYRILASVGESMDRRAQRTPLKHAAPALTATAPNQVWTWDITKLATTLKGVFLMAYVIIAPSAATWSAGCWQPRSARSSRSSSSPTPWAGTGSSPA